MPLPARNLLSEEASPYLQQHRDNPVHWRPWSAAALAEARELDKPILLSVGYAACHWCHVMAHECFEDPTIAALMNRLFVNIKVDREERPDIDQIYMAALTAMGEHGGWPLTMFLTSDAKPFWGGTYFPKEARFGRPAFSDVMLAIHRAWSEKRNEIGKSAGSLSAHVEERLALSASPSDFSPDRIGALASNILSLMDSDKGGLKGAPKFPNAPFLESLWLQWLNAGDTACRDVVLLSLRQMLKGGIYDHLGGGLCRYSTDDQWIIPHFEKMLYDNAQLIRLCAWAFGETGDELFRIRIEETVDWLLREMRVDGGAFASSLDADSEGEEGRFYTWNAAQVDGVLGSDEAAAFYQDYELATSSHWEGLPVIRQKHDVSAVSDAAMSAKRRLLAEREKRVRPGRDDKVLVDWNGLAIAALAEAGRQHQRSDWIDAASDAFRFIMANKEAERLPHSILSSRKLFPALATDYAAMANAAISLFEATQDDAYRNDAQSCLAMLDRWHHDPDGTSYYLTASDATDVPMRIRGDIDDAMPSASAQIIVAMLRTATATDDSALLSKGWDAARAAFGRAMSQPYGQVGIFNACAIAAAPLKLVLVEDQARSRFVPVANRKLDPRRVDLVAALGATSAPGLPASTTLDTSTPGAWLCTGQVCLPPIRNPDELANALRERNAFA